MNLSRSILAFAAAAMVGVTTVAPAEDVDIFVTNPNITPTRPNVLMVIDNAASNNSTITLLNGQSGEKLEMIRQVLNLLLDPASHADLLNSVQEANGVPESERITVAQVQELVRGVNLGLMIYNPSGNASGGYVRYHVRGMDVDANRVALLGKINNQQTCTTTRDRGQTVTVCTFAGIPPANNAPYAKSMYEAYLYYGGKPAYVGFQSNQFDLSAKSGLNYVSPASDQCQANHILYVGNGGPDSGENVDSAALLAGINGRLSTDPIGINPSNFASNWFDEFGRTLASQDVVPDALLSGVQNVQTHAIAVQNPADNSYKTNPMQSARSLLRSGSEVHGKGGYYEAGNAYQFLKGLLGALREIQEVNSVFAASSLPVSVNVRGTFLNQVYMGVFRPDGEKRPVWFGNLKLYELGLDSGTGAVYLVDRDGNRAQSATTGFLSSTSTSFWTHASNYWAYSPRGNPPTASDLPDGELVEKGGAAQRLRDTNLTNVAARKVYTCTGCLGGALLSAFPFSTGNASITQASLGASSAAERDLIIDWIRGVDNIPVRAAGELRPAAHGDVLHSSPAVISYAADDSRVVVYYGANDGLVRAVEGGKADSKGTELWSFVPPEFFGRLKTLRDNRAGPKTYFMDGSVTSLVERSGGAVSKAHLFFTARRGGEFLYALDVTDPDSPKFLWKRSRGDTGYGELGQTWSAPHVTKLMIGGSPTDVLIFGGGYHAATEDADPQGTVTRGRAVLVVNAATGNVIWQAGPNPTGATHNRTESGMEFSVPGDIAVVDRDLDGVSELLYFADTGGNVWRADVADSNPGNWKVHHVAEVKGGRKFLHRPDVVFGEDATGPYHAILVGSGDREKPFSSATTDRFYMFKVRQVGDDGSGINKIKESDLYDATANTIQDGTDAQKAAAAAQLLGADGWYVTLRAGEKVVGSAITLGGGTFFNTNQPTSQAPESCASDLGIARSYLVAFADATALLDRDGTEGLTKDDRELVIPGGGYAPSPTPVIVQIGDKTVEAVISGANVFVPPGVGLETRRRSYWFKESID